MCLYSWCHKSSDKADSSREIRPLLPAGLSLNPHHHHLQQPHYNTMTMLKSITMVVTKLAMDGTQKSTKYRISGGKYMCLALFFVGNDSMWFKQKRCGGKIPTQNRWLLFGDKKRTLKSSNNQKICHYMRRRDPSIADHIWKGMGWRVGWHMGAGI